MKDTKLLKELYELPLPVLGSKIQNEINNSTITPLMQEDKNLLLSDSEMQKERGFTELPSGGWLVAMHNKMQGVTMFSTWHYL